MKHGFFTLFIAIMGGFMSSITVLNADIASSAFHHYPDSSLVRQTVVISIPGGPAFVPIDHQGVCAMLASILDEGPQGMTKKDYLETLFLYSANVSFGGSERQFQIVIEVLPDHFDDVLNLVQSVLDRPKFDQSIFNDTKTRLLHNRKLMNNNMRAVTFYAATRLAFNYHPSVLDGTGSVASIDSLTLPLIEQFYPKLVQLESATIWSAGPMNADRVERQFNRVFKLKPVRQPIRFDTPKWALSNDRLSVIIVDKPEATDHQVLYMYPMKSLINDDREFHGRVAHMLYGGGLTGALGNELRENRGLTYHIGSSLSPRLPYWRIYSFASDDQLLGLLTGIDDVTGQFVTHQESETELDFAKMELISNFRMATELTLSRLGIQLRSMLYGRDLDFVDQFESNVHSVELADIMAYKQQFLKRNVGMLLMMGDQKKLIPLLSSYGISSQDIVVTQISEIL